MIPNGLAIKATFPGCATYEKFLALQVITNARVKERTVTNIVKRKDTEFFVEFETGNTG